MSEIPYKKVHHRPPDEIVDLWFHRARHGGYMALGSRRPFTKRGKVDPAREPAPHYYTVIPLSGRQRYFPQFISQLIQENQTGYLGTNTFRKSVLKPYGREKPEAKYIDAIEKSKPEYFEFTNKNVRELVTIMVDLDVGRDGLFPAEDAVGSLVARALGGHIPHPSMIGYSGRGAYALWFLRERESEAPPMHTVQNAHVWRLITDEIMGKIEDLYPDHNAKRIAQWVKAPGTVDTKTGNTVVYLPFYLSEGDSTSIPLYTLDYLVGELDIHTADIGAPELPEDRKRLIPPTPDFAPSRKPKTGKPSQPQAPSRARYRDLEVLGIHRKKYREGQRFIACMYYFWSVWTCYSISHDRKEAYQEAVKHLREFNQKYCHPPLSVGEIKKLFKAKYRPKVTYRTIVKALGISAEEAEDLDLRQLIPTEVREKRKADQNERGKDKRDRRKDIDRMIRAGYTNKDISAEIPDYARYRHTVCRRRQKLNMPDPATQEHKKQTRMKHK